MARTEFFTVDGGYVLMSEPADNPDGGVLFACSSGENDEGVLLSTEECLRLGEWLLNMAAGR